ncbi:MAG: hypothetical protein QOG56_2842, partial [Solirubrobacteraceae bacterium]|nr:hypothetical protein [Solirubrobacteraceae bacterium]
MTPTGVRDGDPGALEAVCEARGPAVLAYCEVVAGRGPAGAAAAADAFGSFRAGVVANGDLSNVKPEALLIAATRHAAARYAGADLPAPCSRVPALLAARADRSISLADHDFLEEHLGGCWTCRAPVARFEAADRAYLDPPRTPLEPDTAAAIVAAMTAAAAVRGATDDVPAQQDAASLNGHGTLAGPPDEHPAPHESESLDQPTAVFEMPAADLAPAEEPAEEPPRSRGERSRRRPAVLGALGFGGAAAQADAGSSPSAAAATTRTDRPPDAIGAEGAAEPRPRRTIRIGDSAAGTGAAGTGAAGTGATSGGARRTIRIGGRSSAAGAGGEARRTIRIG